MKKIAKAILIVSVFVLLAAGCNQKAVVQLPASQPMNKPANQTPQNAPDVKPGGQTQTKQNADQPDYFPNGQKSPATQIAVRQYIEQTGPDADYQVGVGETALDLLKSTSMVEVKSYSFGDMVIGISGKSADSKHFWELFVNGKSSNVGASAYILKDGDKIEWKLSTLK